MTSVRMDKWLWAARFFKTRALAARACELGRIQSNGQPAKAAREVRVRDMLRVTNDGGEGLASWLRHFVERNRRRTLNTQFLHAAAKSVGMKIKNFCGAALAFDHSLKGWSASGHFGLFANRRRGDTLSRCRDLLSAHCANEPETTTHWRCPVCAGPMFIIERLTSSQLYFQSALTMPDPQRCSLDSS